MKSATLVQILHKAVGYLGHFEKPFLKSKNTWILLFLVEHYPIKTNIIRYYLLPNSTALKLTKNMNI